MKFIVEKEVFDKLENVCFGVVVVKGIDNIKEIERISNFLDISIDRVEDYFKDKKVKELEEIILYREVFRSLGMNLNKFMSLIEVMIIRVVKNKKFFYINFIVDLGNFIFLKYLFLMGVYDMDFRNDDVYVRFFKKGDKFVLFGEIDVELMEEGELIYLVGDMVKIRRWIWR